MSWQDDVGEIATIVLVLYLLLGAVITYPALVVGYCINAVLGIDAAFQFWLLSMGILILLKIFRAYVALLVIYLVTLVPFIFIAIEFLKECYS